MKNSVVALKKKTPIYISYGCSVIRDGDDIKSIASWPYFGDEVRKNLPLMEKVENFFRKEYDNLYPMSFDQKFWIATLTNECDVPVDRDVYKTCNNEINIGVVCPEILEPYGILDWDNIIDIKQYINNNRYVDISHMESPFLVKGYSNFLGITRLVLQYFSNEIIPADEPEDSTIFWDMMKKRALSVWETET